VGVIFSHRSPCLILLLLLRPPLPFFYSRVLIATDVWASGVDVPQASLVINYDVPSCVFFLCSRAAEVLNLGHDLLHRNRESYVHRICLLDQFGKKGVAISVSVCPFIVHSYVWAVLSFHIPSLLSSHSVTTLPPRLHLAY